MSEFVKHTLDDESTIEHGSVSKAALDIAAARGPRAEVSLRHVRIAPDTPFGRILCETIQTECVMRVLNETTAAKYSFAVVAGRAMLSTRPQDRRLFASRLIVVRGDTCRPSTRPASPTRRAGATSSTSPFSKTDENPSKYRKITDFTKTM